MKFKYAMKAWVGSKYQIEDRIRRLEQLHDKGVISTEPLIELHLFPEDIVRDSTKDNIHEYSNDTTFVAHFPQMEEHYDIFLDNGEYLGRVLEFLKKTDVESLVIHRYGGREVRKKSSTKFYEIVKRQLLNRSTKIYIENLGFAGKADLVSPLDHFFPWEYQFFFEYFEDIENVGLCIDTGHAAETSNMFNYLKSGGERDDCFTYISSDDLNKEERLDPIDFMKSATRLAHIHLNDAPLYTSGKIEWAHLTGEGRNLGDGNIDFRSIMSFLSNTNYDGWLVIETYLKNNEKAIEMEQFIERLTDLCRQL